MTTLPKFNEQATCPKCRCEDIATHYRDCAAYRDPAWQANWWSKEYLLRVCQNCHYEWAEMTADAEVQP